MIKLQLTPKQNIFFCSDPHYNHAGIVRGTSSWDGKRGCRDFDTLEEHNNTLVNNINNTVGVDDILFCLGDWNFGDYKSGENKSGTIEFREKINCKNIHLILGNHDSEIRKSDELKYVFSSVQDYLELQVSEFSKKQGVKAFKQRIIMSHYSFRVWNYMHKNEGSWMLFGHSHGSLTEVFGKSMDVGFDTHPKFKPYSYQEIKYLLSKKEMVCLDHHSK